MIDYLNSFGIPQCFKETNGKNVKVAVLDTGVFNHKDLIIKERKDFTNSKKQEFAEHGTNVCGIIAGQKYGIAKKVELYSCKIIDDSLQIKHTYLNDAISWCIDNNINIINLSLGSKIDDYQTHNIIKEAYNKNIIVVCAAGDFKYGFSFFPSQYIETISVVGITKVNSKFSFDNTKEKIDFAINCENIFTTSLNDKYVYSFGTSMSVAFVTGTISLILSKNNKEMNIIELRNFLSNISFDLKYLDNSPLNGFGLIDVNKLKRRNG